jgi:acetyl-CoA C-acetyltransferase
MPKTVILGTARTPVGKLGGGLSSLPATQLGGIAIAAALERAEVAPEQVQHVVMGQVLQAGVGQIPSRQAQIQAGIPKEVSSETINKVCASGVRAAGILDAAIRAGDVDVAVAGGMESMNGAPYLLPNARFGYRLGDGALIDATVHDGLWCSIEACHMGTHAERVAISNSVSREDQDAFALASHEKAIAAIDSGRFQAETAPVTIRDAKGRETVVTVDEGPRRDSSLEALGRLKPVFDLPTGEDRRNAETGTVTAGNAPGITDGAAATVVASERAVERFGLNPLARIVGYAQAGVRRLLDRIELPIEAFDLIEINEAFAAQTLADGRELGFDWDKVNVNGGAIALGHPIGASGARIVATLLHELDRREGRYGLATLCLGGGGSVAMAFERV